MARILVIDDDPLFCKLVELHLGGAGHYVTVAGDAVEGLRAVIQSLPDLVLLDIRMPFMSGLEVLRALKSDPSSREIPVVMITSLDDDPTISEAAMNGADAFLNKPIHKEKLLATMQKFIFDR